MPQQHIYVSIVSGFETLYFLQKEILFIANSKESHEKANKWLEAHAYPAVSILNMYSRLITALRFNMILGTCNGNFGPVKILVQGTKFLENWSVWTIIFRKFWSTHRIIIVRGHRCFGMSNLLTQIYLHNIVSLNKQFDKQNKLLELLNPAKQCCVY